MTQLSRLQKAYREFFTAMLDDYGVKSPAQLGDKKSEFFSKIKKDWAKKKKTMKEGVLRQTIRELVAEELETHKPNITNEAKEVPEHFKKLAKVIIDKKGNFSVKDFEKLGIPFEIFLQMAQVDKNTLVKNAKKLLSQQESKVFNEMEGDEIPGGKGDKTNPNQVDQKELKVGIAVEREHTDSDKRAEEIALDHLTENPHYYSELIKSGIVDEKPALELAKKFGLTEALGHKKYQTTMIKDFKNKKGFTISKGEPVELEFGGTYQVTIVYRKGQYDQKGAVLTQNLYKWVKGVAKPPSFSSLEKMVDNGVAKSVLGKRVESDGVDEYGSPSWLMAMGLI